MGNFREVETPANWKEWIATEDEISRQENLTVAIEENTEMLSTLAQRMEEMMMQTKRLAEAVEDQPRLEDLKCDFTGWNVAEALSNNSYWTEQLVNQLAKEDLVNKK